MVSIRSSGLHATHARKRKWNGLVPPRAAGDVRRHIWPAPQFPGRMVRVFMFSESASEFVELLRSWDVTSMEVSHIYLVNAPV